MKTLPTCARCGSLPRVNIADSTAMQACAYSVSCNNDDCRQETKWYVVSWGDRDSEAHAERKAEQAAMQEWVSMNIPRPAQPVIPEQAEPTISFYRDGIIAAAKWVENQRDAYDNEHGQSDPDTGAFEFGNDAQLEYSTTLSEIAEGIRSLHPASVQPVIPDNDDDDLIQRLSGRAKFLRDKGEIKTPVLIEAAISALSAQPVSEPYKLEIDMDDADHFSITHLHEIIYGKELIWPEAKLLARFMLDVKQRVSAAPAQESE